MSFKKILVKKVSTKGTEGTGCTEGTEGTKATKGLFAGAQRP